MGSVLLVHGVVVAAEYTAVLDWGDKTLMAFPVTGVVQSLHAQPGEAVKKGQLLARMDATPFIAKVKKYKANIARIKPLLADAHRELEQAQELFDQTVLSVVELQKIEGIYQRLQAEDQVARAELALAQWRVNKTQLNAPNDGRLVGSNLLPGMVISRENKAQVGLVLAASDTMQAIASVDAGQLAHLKVGQTVKVGVDDKLFSGQILAIVQTEDRSSSYQLMVKFNSGQLYWAGQPAKVID